MDRQDSVGDVFLALQLRIGSQARSGTVTVKGLMKTAVAACAPDSDLGVVVTISRERDCGFLPVVARNGIVVGVVTDRRAVEVVTS
jgi:predicted transcriptional regulator